MEWWETLMEQLKEDLTDVPGVVEMKLAVLPMSADAATFIVASIDSDGELGLAVYVVSRNRTGNGGGGCS